MNIDNSLTPEEKAAGILTPEIMWKIGRVSGSVISPDAKTVLYKVTAYNMAENKGRTNIWSIASTGGEAVRINGRYSRQIFYTV